MHGHCGRVHGAKRQGPGHRRALRRGSRKFRFICKVRMVSIDKAGFDTNDSMAPSACTRRAWLAAALVAPLAAAASEPGYEWRPWPRKRTAPPLDLPALDGTRFRLAEQRGRPVLLNFWASWCEPCREEMPALVRLAERHAGQGLVLRAVNYREGGPAIRRFLDTLDHPPQVLLDADGEAARAWTPRVFPSTVLIDRRGRPHGVMLGALAWDGAAAEAWVGPLLAAA